MSVQALVEAAKLPVVDVTDLWDTYNGMVSRSRTERRRLQRELAAMGDGNLIDVMDLFKLPEAYGKDGFPLVALAPIDASVIHFQQEGYSYTRFWAGTKNKKGKMRIWSEQFITGHHNRGGYTYTGTTKVPLIPKSVMPNLFSRVVHDHWIMFDTPSWSDKKAIPIDPYLLQRVDGHRFRVLAHWDLTAKERQLMALLG